MRFMDPKMELRRVEGKSRQGIKKERRQEWLTAKCKWKMSEIHLQENLRIFKSIHSADGLPT